MTPIYFTNYQKRQLVVFKEVFMHYLCESYLKCEFKKFALE